MIIMMIINRNESVECGERQACMRRIFNEENNHTIAKELFFSGRDQKKGKKTCELCIRDARKLIAWIVVNAFCFVTSISRVTN